MSSDSTFEVRSPLDWDWKLADVALGDALTADAAVTAAVDAFPDWSGALRRGAGRALHRLADLIDDNIECRCRSRVRRHGDAPGEPRARGYTGVLRTSATTPTCQRYQGRRWSSKGTDNQVQRMPAGPAVIITPWNAPWILSTWKLAPALAAGNTVILKAGGVGAALGLGARRPRRSKPGCPPGVLNVVQGIGRGGRRGSGVGPPGPPHLVHRVAGDGAAHRGVGSPQHRPLHRRVGRQGTVSRVRRLRPRSGGEGRPPCNTTTRARSVSPVPVSSSRDRVSTEFLSCSAGSFDEHVLGDSRTRRPRSAR